MVDVARVNLFGHPMGMFRWDDRYQTVQFEYERDFVGRGWEPSPLMMPVREGRVYSFAGLNRETYLWLPGMLADSLPDTYGRALFEQWLASPDRYERRPSGRTTPSSAVQSICQRT